MVSSIALDFRVPVSASASVLQSQIDYPNHSGVLLLPDYSTFDVLPFHHWTSFCGQDDISIMIRNNN